MQKPTKIQNKHRRLKRVLSILLIIAITTILVVFSLNSDVFNIRKINIKGNYNINKEKILHTSSISIGENIFRISTKDAEECISKLPYVKKVTVKRSLPKGINIEIIERENKLLIKNISMYYVIDDEGYILNQIDKNIEGLPVVFGLKTDKIDIGDNLFLNLGFEEFEDFITEGENLGILSKMERIDIDSEDNVNITINNGIDIAFGKLDNVEYKLRLLNEILIHSNENDILIKKIIMNRGGNPILVVDD
ncbi:MAG: FtsQ-type POTRA domain-containing protein [Tissierellaceae bacterium]|nr:FtsQ-type POTRA domain-containing protein [Tissierellaceae bacterium]